MIQRLSALFLLLTTAGLNLQVSAQSINTVRQTLIDDIASAEAALDATRRDISSERESLTRDISRIQNEVLDLREQTVAARRLADEDTLSLSRIEERLEEWQSQNQFQTRLLGGFLGRAEQSSATGSLLGNLYNLQGYVQDIRSSLYPQWNESSLILPDGQLTQAPVLDTGPVLFYQLDQAAGLAERDDNDMIRIALPLTGNALAGLLDFSATGSGALTFDPTLSTTTLETVAPETLAEHIRKGGIWVVPILAFALFATVTAVFKAISLARLPRQQPALAERLQQAITSGSAAEFSSKLSGPQAGLVDICMQYPVPEQRDEHLYASLLETKSSLEKWLDAIALTAAVAPLLGLLGTVSGMITTFKQMTIFGAGDAAAVSGGISEALVTTELGLVVAIPALVAHALMTRKVKAYYGSLETTAIRLSQLELPGKPR